MVTFSDCMTLLLTFFVLLLSFSSFDEAIFKKLKIIFADALPSVGLPNKQNRDAFRDAEQIKPIEDIGEGSEKPTLKNGQDDGFLEDTEPVDFRSRKVFFISSDEVFWGKGAAISRQGRNVLGNLGAFLREVPGRAVISENGPVNESSEQLGLTRAYAVLEYLATREGLDKKRFSISAASTVPQQNFEKGDETAGRNRMFEVVLLERNIFN
jgi:chemotaxis protein MotB